jgi:hypothetical protein
MCAPVLRAITGAANCEITRRSHTRHIDATPRGFKRPVQILADNTEPPAARKETEEKFQGAVT